MRDGGFESKSEIRDSVEPADLGFGAGLSGKQGGPKLSIEILVLGLAVEAEMLENLTSLSVNPQLHSFTHPGTFGQPSV